MLTHVLAAGLARFEVAEFDPEKVTPGFVGFAFTGLIAAAVILLLMSMNRRVRRMRYREEVREQLEAELAEAAAAEAETPVAEKSASVDPQERGTAGQSGA